MTIEEFIEKFAKLINLQDVGLLSPDTDFHELDEWSSLTAVKLIVFFDEEMGKDVSVKEINECYTIEDLYKL